MKTKALPILVLAFAVGVGLPALADTPTGEKTGKSCKVELAKAYPTEAEWEILNGIVKPFKFKDKKTGEEKIATDPVYIPIGSMEIDSAKGDEISVSQMNQVTHYMRRTKALINQCEKVCGGLPITHPVSGETSPFKCVSENGGIAGVSPSGRLLWMVRPWWQITQKQLSPKLLLNPYSVRKV